MTRLFREEEAIFVSKRNNDFFRKKKDWSKVKDELLGCYLKPYISKILHTRKPLIYVDCFAGKGKFEDGSFGSPLIALKIIETERMRSSAENPKIVSFFIELNHADDLQKNLDSYPYAKVIHGKYEDRIENILKEKEGCNIFLYVDPYGIKALQYALFDRFANGKFYSVELLVNMNSFGFIREGCRVFGVPFKEDIVLSELIEYEPTYMDRSEKSKRELDAIAGGEYWRRIIEAYKNELIDGYEAENQFAEQYCMRLRKSYNYVLNMPLRIKRGQRPKYRLIHATNHRDGCLLMVDNICNRWESLRDIQSRGQLELWGETTNNQIVDDKFVQEKTKAFFSQYSVWISLYDGLADFFMHNGPICSTKDVKKALRKLENDRRLEVIREPVLTPTGKKTKFMEEDKGKRVKLRWRR